MAELFAGAVCGYAIALAVTPLGMIALVRSRATLFGDALPEGTRLTILAIGLHFLSFVVFSTIGLLLGGLLNGIDAKGGLASPNRAYTLIVLVIDAIAVLPLATVAPRMRAPLLASGVLFAGIFGWAMPHLAELAR
jgi:hypothetical protein